MATPHRLTTRDCVPISDARIELTRYLTSEELAAIATIKLPVITVEEGELDLAELLTHGRAFGATVLEGLVMNSLRIGEHTGIQLLGPGDLLVANGGLLPAWLADTESRTAGTVELALFGNDLLAATYRSPRLVEGIYGAVRDQMERVTAQLVICQLPRVDDRVLAMLWLLAESWGQVTPSGVRLPLALTHETLGALVGARRPTVTLALRKLVQDGAIVHQDTGWLLLQRPPEPVTEEEPRFFAPEVQATTAGRWAQAQAQAQAQDPSVTYASLRETVRQLRERHQSDREQTKEQLRRIRSARVRMFAARERMEQNVLNQRRPPSS